MIDKSNLSNKRIPILCFYIPIKEHFYETGLIEKYEVQQVLDIVEYLESGNESLLKTLHLSENETPDEIKNYFAFQKLFES